ncbi:hypothetical protein NDK43_11875 [Neobacillus pocheonensis]|uniref:Transporter n=1 Tax=Neobacillus pocheonensis TaxID=363869 RepID=A0ABT0WD41_9BACI|nr:hypothetical protein [Neobacillus pocheonensis]
MKNRWQDMEYNDFLNCWEVYWPKVQGVTWCAVGNLSNFILGMKWNFRAE